MVTKFIARPIIVDAVQFDGDNWIEVQLFTGARWDAAIKKKVPRFTEFGTYLVATPPGDAELYIDPIDIHLPVDIGDWIVRNNGLYQPWTPIRFDAVYEPIEGQYGERYSST